jgi:hypothetical protein
MMVAGCRFGLLEVKFGVEWIRRQGRLDRADVIVAG